jgi:SAM-dependent methyltransferase
LPDNFIDLALCTEVIEHLPNSPKPLLADMYRILKPGGYLIITTPNIAHLKNRIKGLLGYSTSDRGSIGSYYSMEEYPFGSIYRGHNREYTLNEVEYMLGSLNFIIDSARTCNYGPQSWSDLFRQLYDDLFPFNYSGIKKELKTIYRFGLNFIPKMANFIVVLAHKDI